MAAYSKANILSRIRTILQEPIARLYSDTEINRWIDEAARKVSILTLCNEDSETEVCTASENEQIVWALTTNFIKIDYVTFDPNGAGDAIGLQKVDVINFGNGSCGVGTAAASNMPRFYTYFENTLLVWPGPGSTYAAGSPNDSDIKVHGYSAVDDYGAGASETLPDELQHITIPYTLSCAYCKAGKHSLSALHMQKFMRDCMIHRRDVYDDVGYADSIDSTRIPDVTIQMGQQQ